MAEKRTVSIDLLGVRLGIKTTQTPTEVERVTELFRQRLEAVQRAAGSADTLRVALLAALDITREFVEAKRELEELRDLTAERSLALVERLEAETNLDGETPDLSLPKKPAVA